MDFLLAQIVISKAGRDKGQNFIIYDIDKDFAYIIDGNLRPLAKPKKKKLKHLQPTHYIDNNLQLLIKNGSYIKDSDIRTILKKFNCI